MRIDLQTVFLALIHLLDSMTGIICISGLLITDSIYWNLACWGIFFANHVEFFVYHKVPFRIHTSVLKVILEAYPKVKFLRVLCCFDQVCNGQGEFWITVGRYPDENCVVCCDLICIIFMIFCFVNVSVPCSECISLIASSWFDFMFNLLALEYDDSTHVGHYIDDFMFKV